jgi:hypothetical protein
MSGGNGVEQAEAAKQLLGECGQGRVSSRKAWDAQKSLRQGEVMAGALNCNRGKRAF